MNVTFLIEETGLSDETRAVLALADAMVGRGHVVKLVTTESAPSWCSSSADWAYVDDLGRYVPQPREFVIATSDATSAIAHRVGGRLSAWYCFGGEPPVSEPPLPILAAAEFVKSRFKNVTMIGTVVDDAMYRSAAPREHEPLRVLLSGPSQSETMGLSDGYGAVAHARWFHQKCDLVRVSPWAPSREEPLDSVQEFHVALAPDELARLIQSCDVAVVPHEADTFSLAPMDALAAGLACVFTDVQSLSTFESTPDYARIAPAANAVEMGERLIELLESPGMRGKLSGRGREVAEQWRAPKVAERLEQFLAGRF